MPRRPRGSGSVVRDGAAWAIRYGPRKAKRYEGGFRTKAEAERRLVVLRSEDMNRRLGVAADPRQSPDLSTLADPWLKTRKVTHAAGAEDGSRWRKHLAPCFGHLRPSEVDDARIRAFVTAKRAELSPATIRVCVAILSSLLEELLERKLIQANPARQLPKSILRLMRSDHDPKTVPFIEKLDDVRRVFLGLYEDEPGLGVGYAIGSLAGLRTSEVFHLRWPSVDLAAQRIMVSEGGRVTTKDREPRPVPILDALLPVLEQWRLAHPGTGRVIPPLRCDGSKIDKGTPGPALQSVLVRLGLAREGLGWYEATRHTFASHWAMQGRPLRELQKILGHSSIAITERYAHLAPDYWAPGVHGALPVDLTPGGAVRTLGAPASEAKGRGRGRKT